MKKYLLFISTLFCFFAAVAGTGNTNHKSFSSISSSEGHLYSALAVNYPHTESQVSSHSFSISNTCRAQNLHDFVTANKFTYNHFRNGIPWVNKNTSNFSFKQYLFHNYPSHNFW